MKSQVIVFIVLAGWAAGLAAEKKQLPRKQVQAQYNPKELSVDKKSAKWELSELDAAKKRSRTTPKGNLKK